jgi:hypothetical protein
MTVYAAMGRNTGVAVVVFPGGGYQFLAMDLDGTDFCDWPRRGLLPSVRALLDYLGARFSELRED